MTTQVQFRKGNTSEHSQFTGALAEITVDTQKKTLLYMMAVMLVDLNYKDLDGKLKITMDF